MRTATKIWLIVAASLLAVGLIMFATAMAIYHWDFSKLNMSKYQTNIHAVLDSFQTLSIQTDTADIVFLPS